MHTFARKPAAKSPAAPARSTPAADIEATAARAPRALPFHFGSIAVTPPDDRFEREADAVADSVMRKAARQGIDGGEDEDEAMRIEEGPAEAVQRKAAAQQVTAPASAATDRLAGSRSGGEPLPAQTRGPLEQAFGRDFSRVRVHRDGEADELSRQFAALAFTHGSHIYFGNGRYAPEQADGRRLLAHELTHVAQQGHAAVAADGGGSAAVVQAAPPTIQRAANWTAAALHETNNLANTALNGAAAGVTVPMLNGALGGAVTAPTVSVAAAAAGGFDATVTAVAANAGNVDETVLSAGPWRLVVPRATVAAHFPALTQCTGAENCNFRARGDPSDAAMATANRRHEDHHGTDGQAAFNATVVPWDTALTAARTAGTVFHGATDAAARAALFAAMGGTATTVTNAFITAWNAAIPVFHGTPAGGTIGLPTDPTAAPDCSWAFARFTNPS